MTLVASDSLNEATVNIVVFVKDVNDLPPVFSERSYQATIKEEDDKNLDKPILQVTFYFLFYFFLAFPDI